MYHKTARDFIKKVIRTRETLIRTGESRLNFAIATSHMDTINRYLNYFGYQKDEDMAMFWRRHRTRIMELIPGGSSHSAKGLMDQFNLLDNEAYVHLKKARELAK